MKIGIEAQRIFRERKHGMDFVALELVRSLMQIDQENEYVIFCNEGPDRACLPEAANFTVEVFGGSYPIWEQVYLPRKLRSHEVDMLHCTSNTAPIRCPVPLIVTIHDIIYFEKHPLWARGYSFYQRFGNIYRRWVVRKLLYSADRIITVSHYEARRFGQYVDLPKNKLAVVYNGVGGHFQPVEDEKSKSQMRKRYSLPEHYYLFLGNTDPKKNTRGTVLAFARYCQRHGTAVKLVIGDLDPDLIRGYLREEHLEEYLPAIHFTGYINNQDMPALISMARLFLYTSFRESFGIPILEGMASGTPVITSDCASMPEVAGDAAQLVDPYSQDSIVKALETLEADDQLRRDLREAGLERVKHFQWSVTATNMLEHYREIF